MHDPRVPESLEGWSLLHQMFRVRWNAWRELPEADRARLAGEAAAALGSMTGDDRGATSLTTVLGHKADLGLLLKDLLQAQARSSETQFQYQQALSSYWSAMAQLRRAMGDE